MLNYNIHYGGAVAEYFKVAIKSLENDNQHAVLKSMKEFNSSFRPTYENKANFKPLIEKSTITANASGN